MLEGLGMLRGRGDSDLVRTKQRRRQGFRSLASRISGVKVQPTRVACALHHTGACTDWPHFLQLCQQLI